MILVAKILLLLNYYFFSIWFVFLGVVSLKGLVFWTVGGVWSVIFQGDET